MILTRSRVVIVSLWKIPKSCFRVGWQRNKMLLKGQFVSVLVGNQTVLFEILAPDSHDWLGGVFHQSCTMRTKESCGPLCWEILGLVFLNFHNWSQHVCLHNDFHSVFPPSACEHTGWRSHRQTIRPKTEHEMLCGVYEISCSLKILVVHDAHDNWQQPGSIKHQSVGKIFCFTHWKHLFAKYTTSNPQK